MSEKPISLSEEEKKLLVDVIAYYYEKHIYPLAETDNKQADKKDTSLRHLLYKLGLRPYIPNELAQRF